MPDQPTFLAGGCACRALRDRTSNAPLFVHGCHFTWCQRESGSDRFVRVGMLDEPARCPPDIRIFTSTRQPWVQLPPGAPVVAEYYKASEHWPAASLKRRAALLQQQSKRAGG